MAAGAPRRRLRHGLRARRLERPRRAQHQGVGILARDELQADRQAVAGEAGGHADRRLLGQVERVAEPGPVAPALAAASGSGCSRPAANAGRAVLGVTSRSCSSRKPASPRRARHAPASRPGSRPGCSGHPARPWRRVPDRGGRVPRAAASRSGGPPPGTRSARTCCPAAHRRVDQLDPGTQIGEHLQGRMEHAPDLGI